MVNVNKMLLISNRTSSWSAVTTLQCRLRWFVTANVKFVVNATLHNIALHWAFKRTTGQAEATALFVDEFLEALQYTAKQTYRYDVSLTSESQQHRTF